MVNDRRHEGTRVDDDGETIAVHGRRTADGRALSGRGSSCGVDPVVDALPPLVEPLDLGGFVARYVGGWHPPPAHLDGFAEGKFAPDVAGGVEVVEAGMGHPHDVGIRCCGQCRGDSTGMWREHVTHRL